MGFFNKIKQGLKKTRESISGSIGSMLNSFTKIDEELFEELEELLVMGDVGMPTAEKICAELRARVKEEGVTDPQLIMGMIQDIVAEMISGDEELHIQTKPSIILVIGVNGVGKTTTIGKLAAMYKSEGKKVILGAADTFRAAAIDQLQIWADRAGVDIVKHSEGADPAAVVFDTINAAKARNCDIVIIDTAGRLHNKKNLMDELAKMYRIIDRELPYSDREVLLVLDATTGQNAVNQAREFMNAAEITGIVLTKLDGTARGGVVLTIKNELGIPVKFIGVGEQIDDLQPFNPRAFADGLFEKIDYNEEDEKDGISQEDVAPDGQIIQAAGSQQIGHTDKDEQSGKDEDKKEEGKVKADADAADESGVHGLEQSEKDIEDAPSDAEKPKKKKEKKRFGFFNRHS